MNLMLINSDEMDHSPIPYVKRTRKFGGYFLKNRSVNRCFGFTNFQEDV